MLYILTLYPSVGFMDSGELAAACYTFGIPHPTGYPLFILIGYIFSHLPFGSSIIYKLNFLSAIESAFSVVVTYYTSLQLSGYLLSKLFKAQLKKNQNLKQKNKNHDQIENVSNELGANKINQVNYFLSFAAAICIGLTPTFWQNALQVEVYALHTLFLSFIIYFAVKIFTSVSFDKKNWIGLFVFTGLSFSNHLTTVFIIPSLIYLIYFCNSNRMGSYKQIFTLVIYSIPGILLYAILIIASSNEPYLNWSNVSDVSNLFDHLRGADYSNLMFSSSAKFSVNAADFFKHLPAELNYLPLLLSLAGFVVLWKYFKSFAVFSFLSIIFTLLYSFNYNIVDINSYYFLAYYFLILALPGGILYLISFGKPENMLTAKNNFNSAKNKIIAFTIILVILSAGINYSDNNNSSDYANAELTLNSINPLPQNSVVITYDWAYIYSASLYYQLAEKIRPDLKIFNIKFLSAKWYLNMIKKYHPELYEGVKNEAEEYIKVIDQDTRVKTPKLSALVTAFINFSENKFPLFVTVDAVVAKEMKPFFDKFKLVPSGFLYRVEPKNSPYDPNAGNYIINESFTKFKPNTDQKKVVFNTIPGMIFETANYHYINKNFELSLKLLNKALEFNPDFKDALYLKNSILQQKK